MVLNAGTDVHHPLIPPTLQPFVPASGLDVQAIHLAYDAVDDVLSVGLEGPPNGIDGRDVIAGDVDDNLNSATVSPQVQAIEPDFLDFADLGGTETMGAFLDLNNDGTPDIVAGIPNKAGADKFYQVAPAIVNPVIPTAIPDFGTPLPQFTGNVYLVNDPNHPNFEFSIKDFSKLYQSVTGQALTSTSPLRVGAFGNSDNDDGISEAFFPAQPVPGLIPPPPAPPTTDLAIVKTDLPDPVQAGQVLTYILSVRNNGPDTATGVAVKDNLPPGTTFVQAVPSQGTVSQADGVLTADLGTLASGASAQVTVSVIPTAPGQITNGAVVTGNETDTNPNNNQSQVITTVVPPPVCPPPPPKEPHVLINPHSHRHVNTAHQTLIRVNVFGSAGFDVNQIVPGSVRLGGAAPVDSFTRAINRDPYPDATFVFQGTDVNLPPGITNATVTGQLTDGTGFASTTEIFDRNYDFYRTAAIDRQAAEFARRGEPEPAGAAAADLNAPSAQTISLSPAAPPAATTTGGPSFAVQRPAASFFALNRRANLQAQGGSSRVQAQSATAPARPGRAAAAQTVGAVALGAA